MSMHSCARKQSRPSLLFSDSLFRKVVSLLAAWAMVMSSLPAYAADAPHISDQASKWKLNVSPPQQKDQSRGILPLASRQERATVLAVRRMLPKLAAMQPLGLSAAGKSSSSLLSW